MPSRASDLERGPYLAKRRARSLKAHRYGFAVYARTRIRGIYVPHFDRFLRRAIPELIVPERRPQSSG